MKLLSWPMIITTVFSVFIIFCLYQVNPHLLIPLLYIFKDDTLRTTRVHSWQCSELQGYIHGNDEENIV
jgi:hypothetical protein